MVIAKKINKSEVQGPVMPQFASHSYERLNFRGGVDVFPKVFYLSSGTFVKNYVYGLPLSKLLNRYGFFEVVHELRVELIMCLLKKGLFDQPTVKDNCWKKWFNFKNSKGEKMTSISNIPITDNLSVKTRHFFEISTSILRNDISNLILLPLDLNLSNVILSLKGNLKIIDQPFMKLCPSLIICKLLFSYTPQIKAEKSSRNYVIPKMSYIKKLDSEFVDTVYKHSPIKFDLKKIAAIQHIRSLYAISKIRNGTKSVSKYVDLIYEWMEYYRNAYVDSLSIPVKDKQYT